MWRARFAAIASEVRRQIDGEGAMLAKRDRAVRLAAFLLPALLAAFPAIAEGNRESQSSPAASEQPKQPRAPIGHRQPTAADIPKDVPKDAAAEANDKRERELDAKLRICRGC
jgi:hypothetical protein